MPRVHVYKRKRSFFLLITIVDQMSSSSSSSSSSSTISKVPKSKAGSNPRHKSRDGETYLDTLPPELLRKIGARLKEKDFDNFRNSLRNKIEPDLAFYKDKYLHYSNNQRNEELKRMYGKKAKSDIDLDLKREALRHHGAHLTNLWSAIKHGDIDGVKKWIQKNSGSIFDARDGDETALQVAVSSGQLGMVKFLVSQSLDPETLFRVKRRGNGEDYNLLANAIVDSKSLEMVKYIVRNMSRSDVLYMKFGDDSALHDAVALGVPESIVAYLLDVFGPSFVLEHYPNILFEAGNVQARKKERMYLILRWLKSNGILKQVLAKAPDYQNNKRILDTSDGKLIKSIIKML